MVKKSNTNNLILIINPGSSSRKYAIYDGRKLVMSLHFEYENQKVICTLTDANGKKRLLDKTFLDFDSTAFAIRDILDEEGVLGRNEKFAAILARVVAPGDYFTADHLVEEECFKQLEVAKRRAPLHVPVVAKEIEQFVKFFEDVPVIAISDSAFHANKPAVAKFYAINADLADEHEIKRYGYHGLSVGSVVEYMKSQKILPKKLVVCHIGSGTSVTAVLNGVSVENSMGYSPLEGAVMSTRAGDIDTAAAMAVKQVMKFDDEELKSYLNKKSGLFGLSGETNDMREIIDFMKKGDVRAKFAYDLFIYRLQTLIGKMAAVMDGVDALVFTATIGERNAMIRSDIMKKLDYLGLEIDADLNNGKMSGRHTNIASGKKPVYVISTDEFEEMLRRAEILLKK